MTLTSMQHCDLSILENELRNHIYSYISLRDNVRSCGVHLSIHDLREISNKAARTASKILTRIINEHGD